MASGTIWTDWNFWQLVVAAIAALLGFLGGTVISHALERRRDRERQAEESRILAGALHAEVSAIKHRCQEQMRFLGPASGVSAEVIETARAISLPSPTIYGANAGRLGLLPVELARDIVAFYGLRSGTQSLFDQLDKESRTELLGWLMQMSVGADRPLRGLADFLGYTPAEPAAPASIADVPVRNFSPSDPRT